MEELVKDLPGIMSTIVGYRGGDVKHITYRNHGTHAEAIDITFDPENYRTANCWSFFSDSQSHNEEQARERYRRFLPVSIFYPSDEQKKTAQELIAQMTASAI